jgi:hypothetical protein
MKDDTIIKALLEKYWRLIKTENIGSTPGITKELDNLEQAIRKLRADPV